MEDMLMQESYITPEDMPREGNIFIGLLDNIMKDTGNAITRLLDRSLKFNTKKIEIEEIEKILTKTTRVCVHKLYSEECGPYSLKYLLNDAELSSTMNKTAVNNITYAVMTALSPIVLGSLFYYYSKDFIFFFIRDSIVEMNYRDFIKEIREKYEQPKIHENEINTLNKFKDAVISLSESLLINASDSSTHQVNDDLDHVRELIPQVSPDQAEFIIQAEVKYPLPRFLMDILCGRVSDKTSEETDLFLKNLKRTFTLSGLREVYKEYGHIKAYGETFEMKLAKMYEDRKIHNGSHSAIDNLTLEENNILAKMVIFKPLTEREIARINDNVILSRIKDCLSIYPTVGIKVTYDNDKLTIVYNNKVNDFFYYSENASNDIKSPFTMFGTDFKNMERIYNTEPEKFCTNQAILSKKEKSTFIMDGRKEPNTLEQKQRHNRNLMNSLLRIKSLTSNPSIMNEVNQLRSGNIDEIKYIKTGWFGNVVIDEPRLALLTLAEMEGLNTKISRTLNNTIKNETIPMLH